MEHWLLAATLRILAVNTHKCASCKDITMIDRKVNAKLAYGGKVIVATYALITYSDFLPSMPRISNLEFQN